MTENHSSRRTFLWRAVVLVSFFGILLGLASWYVRGHFELEGPTCSEGATAVSIGGRFESKSVPVPIDPAPPGGPACRIWVHDRRSKEAGLERPVPSDLVETWSETVDRIHWMDERTFIATVFSWPPPSRDSFSYSVARLTNSPHKRVERRCEVILDASQLPSNLTKEERTRKISGMKLAGGKTVICSPE